jgi:hypothetical protein
MGSTLSLALSLPLLTPLTILSVSCSRSLKRSHSERVPKLQRRRESHQCNPPRFRPQRTHPTSRRGSFAFAYEGDVEGGSGEVESEKANRTESIE